MSEIFTMFSYPFIQKALAVGILTGVISAVLGVSLVLKNYSMIGDGLSHVGFGSFAIAAAASVAPLYFSVVIVVIAAYFILKIDDSKKINSDAAIALISSAALAIGVMITSLTKGMSVDIYQFMFGSILAVSDGEMYFTILITFVVALFYAVFYNRIFAITFDEDFARAEGINVDLYRALLSIVTAIVIVLGMRVIGTLLISGLTIIPAISAFQICKSFKASVIVSALVSFVSVFFGIVASFILSTPTGATIIVISVIIFLICFGIKTAGSNLKKRAKNDKLS